MTFNEFMEAAGYRVYRDEILGGAGFMWNAENGEPRGAIFDPTPPSEMWWTISARLRDDPKPDTPLDFYRLERFRVIAVIVPVLGRPQNAQPLADSLAANTTIPHRLIFVCSPGDTDQIDACSRAGGGIQLTHWQPGHADFARKVNLAYRVTTEPWLFQAADDIRFEPGWDRALLECHARTGALVIGTQDGGNPEVKRGRHSTHTLIARSYIDDPGASMDGPGTVFSEAYGHQYCDLELVEVAKRRKVWEFCDEARVIHEHPFWNRDVARDDTYRKGMEASRLDRTIYARRGAMWKRLHA